MLYYIIIYIYIYYIYLYTYIYTYIYLFRELKTPSQLGKLKQNLQTRRP